MTGFAEDTYTVCWSLTTGDATTLSPSIHRLVSARDNLKSRNIQMCPGTIVASDSGWVDPHGGRTLLDLTDPSRSVLGDGRSVSARKSLTLRKIRAILATIRMYSGALDVPRLFLAIL